MGHVAQCSVNEEAFEFVLATKQWTLGPAPRSYSIHYLQMRAPKTAAYYISPIEIGLL